MVATVTAVDTLTLTAGAIHTTVVGGTDMDGIVMIGIVADGITMDTSLRAVTVDGVMMADSVMMAANTLSPIQDISEEDIAADPTGRQIVRRFLTPFI